MFIRKMLAAASLLCGLLFSGPALLAAESPPVAKQAALPNVVLFLADDLGWGDLGCYGHSRIKTPHLDRFATQGLKLTRCYAASGVCSPSRSAILTGRTPYRNGVFTWIPPGREIHLRQSEITIARLLRDRGYATCHTGKWHLNGYFNDPRHPQPDDHGYDWWLATQNNAAPSHKNPVNFVRNGEPVGELTGYSAPLVVEEGIQWLKQHRDPERPFLLSVCTHEPHLPIESDPQFQDLYADLPDPDQRQHHGNISQLDAAFGQLMTTLDELHLTDNTLVIFTSDNGPEGDGVKARNRGSTGGLRGRKRDVYEGGIRVPGLVRWPGHIQPGSVSSVPVIGSDLFPTICAAAQIPVPQDRVIDGGDLGPVFAGQTEVVRQRPLYWRCAIAANWPKIAMRIGDWKIVSNEKLNRFELYNIEQDPREENNLTEREPEHFAEMREAIKSLNAEIEGEGPDWWKNYEHAGRPTTTPAPETLLNARRVVFLGDSITYSGQYVAYLEAYLTTRFPGKKLDFIEVGLPSETVSGLSEPGHAGGAFPRPDLHERLERVLQKMKPDLIVACYGMNCGMYYPFSGERLQKYQSGLMRLRETAARHGAQVIHLTPPSFDPLPLQGRTLPAGRETYEQPYEGYNDVLTRYSDWLMGQKEHGWTVIDLHRPMDLHLAARRQTEPGFVLAGDGVHASPTGHWLMAQQILQTLDNAIIPIQAIIDARARSSRNPQVRAITAVDSGLSWQWKCRVPLAVDPAWDRTSLERLHFQDRINVYRLVIQHLEPGTYELREGDAGGTVLRTFSAEEAAQGLDLLTLPRLRTNQQATELLKLVVERQRLLTDAWLTETGHLRPGMPQGVPIGEATEKAAELTRRIRELARPVDLRFRLTRASTE